MSVMPGTGWVPDVPDERDYSPDSAPVQTLLGSANCARPIDPAQLPPKVDLRASFPPVFQQSTSNSCTAQSAAAVVAYFQKVTEDTSDVPSRLFIYKATRQMLQTTADAGAYIRTTIGSLRLFGAPPERYWPFVLSNINVEPPPFAYAYGSNFRAIEYYRYDPPGASKQDVLARIKTNLAAKLPAMFGFYLFPSIATSGTTGKIPFPSQSERPTGGHAMVAAGYDDSIIVQTSDGKSTSGAFLIRNSWGPEWGDGGYGWLPYDYVLADMANDWWSLIKADWVSTGRFLADTKLSAGGSGTSTTTSPSTSSSSS